MRAMDSITSRRRPRRPTATGRPGRPLLTTRALRGCGKTHKPGAPAGNGARACASCCFAREGALHAHLCPAGGPGVYPGPLVQHALRGDCQTRADLARRLRLLQARSLTCRCPDPPACTPVLPPESWSPTSDQQRRFPLPMATARTPLCRRQTEGAADISIQWLVVYARHCSE